eukprot:Tbor_TRINITY_DN9960_c0_g1::TRINITY_DN9960_c0_g1_i1::g.17700::m.17700
MYSLGYLFSSWNNYSGSLNDVDLFISSVEVSFLHVLFFFSILCCFAFLLLAPWVRRWIETWKTPRCKRLPSVTAMRQSLRNKDIRRIKIEKYSTSEKRLKSSRREEKKGRDEKEDIDMCSQSRCEAYGIVGSHSTINKEACISSLSSHISTRSESERNIDSFSFSTRRVFLRYFRQFILHNQKRCFSSSPSSLKLKFLDPIVVIEKASNSPSAASDTTQNTNSLRIATFPVAFEDRIILMRHGERLDHVLPKWRQQSPVCTNPCCRSLYLSHESTRYNLGTDSNVINGCSVGNRNIINSRSKTYYGYYKETDPPLSFTGRKQCVETALTIRRHLLKNVSSSRSRISVGTSGASVNKAGNRASIIPELISLGGGLRSSDEKKNVVLPCQFSEAFHIWAQDGIHTSPFQRCMESALIIWIIAFDASIPFVVNPTGLSDYFQAKVFGTTTVPEINGVFSSGMLSRRNDAMIGTDNSTSALHKYDTTRKNIIRSNQQRCYPKQSTPVKVKGPNLSFRSLPENVRDDNEEFLLRFSLPLWATADLRHFLNSAVLGGPSSTTNHNSKMNPSIIPLPKWVNKREKLYWAELIDKYLPEVSTGGDMAAQHPVLLPLSQRLVPLSSSVDPHKMSGSGGVRTIVKGSYLQRFPLISLLFGSPKETRLNSSRCCGLDVPSSIYSFGEILRECGSVEVPNEQRRQLVDRVKRNVLDLTFGGQGTTTNTDPLDAYMNDVYSLRDSISETLEAEGLLKHCEGLPKGVKSSPVIPKRSLFQLSPTLYTPPQSLIFITHADIVSAVVEAADTHHYDRRYLTGSSGISVPYCSFTMLTRPNYYYDVAIEEVSSFFEESEGKTGNSIAPCLRPVIIVKDFSIGGASVTGQGETGSRVNTQWVIGSTTESAKSSPPLNKCVRSSSSECCVNNSHLRNIKIDIPYNKASSIHSSLEPLQQMGSIDHLQTKVRVIVSSRAKTTLQ